MGPTVIISVVSHPNIIFQQFRGVHQWLFTTWVWSTFLLFYCSLSPHCYRTIAVGTKNFRAFVFSLSISSFFQILPAVDSGEAIYGFNKGAGHTRALLPQASTAWHQHPNGGGHWGQSPYRIRIQCFLVSVPRTHLVFNESLNVKPIDLSAGCHMHMLHMQFVAVSQFFVSFRGTCPFIKCLMAGFDYHVS